MTGHPHQEKALGYAHVFVAGAGAWGTALALVLHRAGAKVTLWTRNETVVSSIKETGMNQPYLPAIPLPKDIAVTTNEDRLSDADAFLCAIPAQYMRDQLPRFRDVVGQTSLPVLLSSKGIEQSTGLLMHQVLKEVWPTAKGAVVSGPSFAADVAKGLPTAVTVAAFEEIHGERWLHTLAAPNFRPYYSDDVLGVELGGAIKNVLAIACGVVEGKGLGESAKAALITRGFAECIRFAVGQGAQGETLNGLSGLGDIILTCSSRQSRNMSLGYEIGQGGLAKDILAGRSTVAEGAATA
ncbi:MAG: NAD(P)H-dependent glycerol-3-phosphate dehydrogenase, partial [Pseudomonadota bacterium]